MRDLVTARSLAFLLGDASSGSRVQPASAGFFFGFFRPELPASTCPPLLFFSALSWR